MFNLFLSKNLNLSLLSFIRFMEFSFIAFYTFYNFRKFKKNFYIPFLAGLLFESSLAVLQVLNQGSLNGIFYFLGERFFTPETPNIANASISGQLILRPYGTFSHPNVLAAYIVFSTIFVLPALRMRKKKTNILILLSFVLSEAALVLTLSRASLILYSVLIPLVSFLLIKNKKLLKEGIFIFITSLVPLLTIFIFYNQRILELFGESLSKRIDLIKAAFFMISDNPLFGVGIGNFLPEVIKYYRPLVFFDIQPVHNIYILIASEIGMIGLFFFLSFMFALLFRAKKISLIILLFFLTSGFFDHYYLTLIQGQLLFALITAIVWSKVDLLS